MRCGIVEQINEDIGRRLRSPFPLLKYDSIERKLNFLFVAF